MIYSVEQQSTSSLNNRDGCGKSTSGFVWVGKGVVAGGIVKGTNGCWCAEEAPNSAVGRCTDRLDPHSVEMRVTLFVPMTCHLMQFSDPWQSPLTGHGDDGRPR